MAQLLHGDCITEMKQIENRSVDLIFCDLPYGCTSCAWDNKIDLQEMWKEFMRIKKFTTPIFFTTTTKFGVELINNAPKDCPFRYDLVWCKSSPCGHLCAKKMPMRKHEMLYVFYERLPLYDISSHKHKFLRECKGRKGQIYKDGEVVDVAPSYKYTPPLPTSLIKEEEHKWVKTKKDSTYGEVNTEDNKELGGHKQRYEPPLPTSLIKEEDDKRPTETYKNESTLYGNIDRPDYKRKGGESMYNPPLPTSLIKEEEDDGIKKVMRKNTTYGDIMSHECKERKNGEPRYEPALPTSLLEIKSTRGKHSTEKPVALMDWILKYYSKEGDTVLDPTMGSGSMGKSCINMNRNFIGIEMDDEIYEGACARIWGE